MNKRSKVLALARRQGILRAKDVLERRLPREYLPRLAAEGLLLRASRGLYVLRDADFSAQCSVAEVAAAVPQGVICLLTALRFHELTTQNPPDIWVALPPKVWRPRSIPFPACFVQMSGASFDAGVEIHVIDNVSVRIYSPAKTVADCFKFRNKTGLDVAIEALRDFLHRHRGGTNEVWRYAEVCRVAQVIRPYLEAMP